MGEAFFIGALIITVCFYMYLYSNKQKEEEERIAAFNRRIKEAEQIAAFEQIRQSAEYKSKIATAKFIQKLFNTEPKEYLPHSLQDQYWGMILEILEYFNPMKLIACFPEYTTVVSLREIKQNYSGVLSSFNEAFIKGELQRYNAYFNDIDGKSLDLQQRTAVITNEDNTLVVAGAGSGKTLTISGKVKYLCDSNRATPNQILLISFTKKASEEMNERIGNKFSLDINATTFHKLGLDIITKETHERPNVADFINVFVRNYLRSHDLHYTFISKLVVYLAYYLNAPSFLLRLSSEGAYIDSLRSQKWDTLKGKVQKQQNASKHKTTINGETVKSYEEVLIANFLFLHGVEYQYESEYPFKSDSTRKKYCPDFYLPKYNLYLEHFGIDENEKCNWLSDIEAKKYIDDMKWKREFHKIHHTKLLETYSYYNKQGILLEKLEQLLIENSVAFTAVNEKIIFEKLLDQAYDSDHARLTTQICSFITLFKSKGYDGDDFKRIKTEAKQREQTRLARDRTIAFLDIVEPIYHAYQEKLKSQRCIDFSDMINMATKLVENKKDRMAYRYIIIDEYQDIGWDRARLVKAIINNTKARLMCVGDDWQSIYRFAGSDISLFSKFKEFWGYSQIMPIEKTYRNSQELLDIAGPFVMSNPSQLVKHLVSDTHFEFPVQIVYYDTFAADVVARILDGIAEAFGSQSSVMLLGRVNKDKDILQDSERNVFTINGTIVKYEKYPEMKIDFSTVHKAKGLEADNVIIINMKNDLLGFPSQIVDDPILSYVLSDMDPYPYAEERRLMYVALTRTKHAAYLLTPTDAPSCFVEELQPFCTVTNGCNELMLQSQPHCPKCQKGYLVPRMNTTSRKNFVGCSNYPICDYTSPYTEVLQHPIVCGECGGYMVKRAWGGGEFYGCSNYPYCRNTFRVDDFTDEDFEE